MELIKLDDVMAKANELYVEAKIKKGYYNPSYSPPEFRPEISSEQVKAVAQVLVNELNQAIADLQQEILYKTTKREWQGGPL